MKEPIEFYMAVQTYNINFALFLFFQATVYHINTNKIIWTIFT